MSRDLDFVGRVLAVLDHHDQHDDLHWRCGPKYGGGEYPTPAAFFVKCSDVFFWGTADLEEITPENFDVFAGAYDDAAATCECGECSGAHLFVARVRRMRPQGAAYPDEPQLWPLFNACGPEREVGLGNPQAHPRDRQAIAPASVPT